MRVESYRYSVTSSVVSALLQSLTTAVRVEKLKFKCESLGRCGGGVSFLLLVVVS